MKDLLPKIDSQDGEFHNGDPASGTQGTRVTAEWLNDVQAHLRNYGQELKYLLSKASLSPIPSRTTQVYDAIVAVINANKATTLAGYGIGDFAQRALTASDNLNDITVKGIYHNSTYRNTPNNNYPEEQSGVLLVLSAEEQIYFASNGKMFKRLKSNNNWANGWVRLDNLTTPIGADQNLDEITTDGNYYIVGSSKATLAKNYPVERGDGALEVFGNGYFQRFTTFHSHQVFNRRKVGGNWTNWVMSADDKSEIRQKTIDYTKAEGYTYSGFYRPNGDKLNNLPLASLMMHITHPNYTTNAHARGIGFSYGSCNGNQAWDIFTTAFDANGTYLGQKQIMTELGGIFTGNVTAPNLTATGLINIAGNTWGRIRAILPDGGYWQWEVNPASATDPRFNYVYRSASGEQRCLAFPQLTKNEVVAYRGWVDEKIQSIIPVGAVVAFPNAVQNPHGFLRCDGSTFGQETYPALYQALGVNTLPDLRCSDVGMTAYFATDNIPAGWIAFDDIEEQVSEQAYPELYRHLVAKYGSLSAVPKAKDRFIRNAGALLAVGEVQEDALQDHFHYIPTEAGGDYQAEKNITVVIRDSDTTDVEPGAFKPAQKGRVQANNSAVAGGARAKTYLASTKDTTEKDTRTAEETRPKSLVLKLCIKAQNTLDGVQFWIKAFGNVSNAGELEVSRLAQDMQQVRLEKADISHTHTASEITDLKLLIKESIARSISNKSVIGGFKVMKYPDGTMIQTYCFNQNDIVGTREKSFMWPEAFIDIPLIFASLTTSVNTSHDCGINILTKSNKSQCFYYEYEHGTLNQGAMRIQFLAIGRWKTSRRSRETVLAPEVLEELESYFREAGLST